MYLQRMLSNPPSKVEHSYGENMVLLWTLHSKSSWVIESHLPLTMIRTDGLVEIWWRGKRDYHSTMASHSPKDVTRWGSSIQLTMRGVAAISKAWSMGLFERSIRPIDRVMVTKYRKLNERQKKESKV